MFVMKITKMYKKKRSIPGSEINNEFAKKLSMDASRQVMTLLKNKDNTLPWSLNDPCKIAIIGPHYNVMIISEKYFKKCVFFCSNVFIK